MNKKTQVISIFAILLISTGILLGCDEKVTSDQTEEVAPSASNVEEVPKEMTEEQIAAESEKKELTVSAEPQSVEFTTSDGVSIRGKLYPSNKISAPLVILMHWALGDQADWVEVAFWLQNRRMGGGSTFNELTPWLDPSWFPEIAEETTYNVLTFTFRNCEGGCSSFEREKWYTDVQAAVDFGQTLDGVDTSRVIMIGASIGSDGAVDGCAYLNEKTPGNCLGAISMSPGNYLTIDFAEKVKELAPVPVWCLYAESDPESAPLCGSVESSNYTKYKYPANMIFSNGHGMNLIEKDQDPNPLDLTISFLNKVLW